MTTGLYYCENCGKYTDTYTQKREEVYDVRGDKIVINGEIRVCEVRNHAVYDEVLDSVIIEKAFNKFRKIYGYLDESEIKAVRKNYGLSLEDFAALLGTESATVERYETGCVPTFSHHEVLKDLKAVR